MVETTQEQILKQIIVKTDSIGISRVPFKLKEQFIELAKEEFCNDYGLTLRHIWDQFVEYQMFKQQILDGNYKIALIESNSVTAPAPKEGAKGIRLMDGSVRKGVFKREKEE